MYARMLQFNEMEGSMNFPPFLTNNPSIEEMSVMAKTIIPFINSEGQPAKVRSNNYVINGDVVKMEVVRNSTGEKFWVQCDVDAMPTLMDHYWVMENKRDSVVCNFRQDGKMVKPTLHKMFTGSKFVKSINGDKADFRLANLEPSESNIYGKRKIGKWLKGNPYLIHGDCAMFWTTDRNGNKIGKFLIDTEDLNLALKYTWSINYGGYVQSTTGKGRNESRAVLLHRLIIGVKKGSEVDHINRIKTDNRRFNLRICSKSENIHNQCLQKNNSSGHKGVRKVSLNTWLATIQVNGQILRKSFYTFEQALDQRYQWEKTINPSGIDNELL